MGTAGTPRGTRSPRRHAMTALQKPRHGECSDAISKWQPCRKANPVHPGPPPACRKFLNPRGQNATDGILSSVAQDARLNDPAVSTNAPFTTNPENPKANFRESRRFLSGQAGRGGFLLVTFLELLQEK